MTYRVERGILWWFKGQEISHRDLLRWYTEAAVREFIKSGYLSII